MPESPQSDHGQRPQAALTELFERRRAGDPAAEAQIFTAVRQELRAMARNRLARSSEQTLQATELVHELYLRLFDKDQLDCANRRHFFSIAARGMEDILIERARQRGAQKRGGSLRRVELSACSDCADRYPEEFLTLSRAISRLSEHDEESAEIVRLRFFVGLTGEETAEAMGVSPSKVDRGWKYAKAWLHEALYGDGG